MTKLINLDELAAHERVIEYQGSRYEVLDLPVSEFIEFQKDFDVLVQAQAQGDISHIYEMSQKIISRTAPSFHKSGHLEKLNLRQIVACVQLCANFYPSQEEVSEAQAMANAGKE